MSKREYVDLSVTVNERTPVYPGDAPVTVTAAGVIGRDGWNDHVVSMNTHVGTHVDAPLHMIAAGAALDTLPVERFVGEGRLVDATSGFTMEAIRQAAVQEGDIVLFHTGMSERYYEPGYFADYPVMSIEIAQYLVDCNVSMVGVDCGSVDNAEDFPIHKCLLGGNVLIIENLTNLERLRNKAATIYAFPIKLDKDGAPARVVAAIQA